MVNTATNNKPINLQDNFLNHVRKENLAVVIYLVNGFQIRGLVKGFDNFTVIIENEGSRTGSIKEQCQRNFSRW